MNFEYLSQVAAREKQILNEIFACEQLLERKENELLEDLAYFQGRLLASVSGSAQARTYREHIQSTQALLAEIYLDENVSREEFCYS